MAIVLALFVLAAVSDDPLHIRWSDGAFAIRILITGAGYGMIIGYPAILIVGLPLYFMIRWFGIYSRIIWIVLAMLATVLIFLTLVFWSSGGGLPNILGMPLGAAFWFAVVSFIILAVGGAVAGLVCWLFVRPDRSGEFRPRLKLEKGEQSHA